MATQQPSCAAATQTSATQSPAAQALAGAVAHAAKATRAVVDEQYTLTAVVVERPVGEVVQTVVVELIDHGPGTGGQRWLAIAYDELTDRATGLSSGSSAEAALADIAWASLAD